MHLLVGGCHFVEEWTFPVVALRRGVMSLHRGVKILASVTISGQGVCAFTWSPCY
jgi:hypothetical protein